MFFEVKMHEDRCRLAITIKLQKSAEITYLEANKQ